MLSPLHNLLCTKFYCNTRFYLFLHLAKQVKYWGVNHFWEGFRQQQHTIFILLAYCETGYWGLVHFWAGFSAPPGWFPFKMRSHSSRFYCVTRLAPWSWRAAGAAARTESRGVAGGRHPEWQFNTFRREKWAENFGQDFPHNFGVHLPNSSNIVPQDELRNYSL